jgi:hypothetical protein
LTLAHTCKACAKMKEAFKKIKLKNTMCIAQIKRGLAKQAPFPSNSHT